MRLGGTVYSLGTLVIKGSPTITKQTKICFLVPIGGVFMLSQKSENNGANVVVPEEEFILATIG
jgi:hypothetical protein